VANKSGTRTWKALGNYIKRVRIANGVSQLALAKKLGFSSQFLGRIEGGKAPLPDKVFSRLVRQLKLERREISRIFVIGAQDYVNTIFAGSIRRTR